MRILITADAEIPVPPENYGGIERIIASLVEELRRHDHEVGLVAHCDSKVKSDSFFSWPGMTSTRMIDSVRNATRLRRVVSQFKPDLLHSFSRLAWLAPLSLSVPSSRLRSLPLLMSYQREPTGRTVSISRKIHGNRLKFTACSEQLAQKGRERGGGNWTAIPNFIDPDKFTFVPEVSEDAPLVFLSRIEPIKGCHNAIAIAKATGRRLLIAGNRVEEGTAIGYWEQEIEPHIGRDGIEYIGPVNDDEKDKLLGRAAALVVPIEWDEPFGIVFAEALACGTPVVSTPRGSLPEIINHNTHGFLVSDIASGIEAIGRLRTISRSSCRARVLECFSLGKVTKAYLDMYSSFEIAE